MTAIRQDHRHLAVACELDHAEAGARSAEWEQLRIDSALGAEPVAGGARLWLRLSARQTAEDLVRREAKCCGFLDLELAEDGDRLRLELTSPVPQAGPVIACLVGLEPNCTVPCC